MALSVFLDTNVQKSAVDLRWGEEVRSILWGGTTHERKIEVVKPRPPRPSQEAWLQSELDLLPVIGEAARRGEIVCFDNQEVRFELMNLRYGGLVRSQMSGLHGVTITKVPPPLPERVVVFGDRALWEDQKKSWARWLRSWPEPRFAELRSVLGTLADNTLVDLYHVYSAERANLDCFLTLDAKFVRQLRQKRAISTIEVLYPSELLARLTP